MAERHLVWRFFQLAKNKKSELFAFRLQVRTSQKMEHSGFEPLTPTLPVLCATNCANAPSTMLILSWTRLFVKRIIGQIEKRNHECYNKVQEK